MRRFVGAGYVVLKITGGVDHDFARSLDRRFREQPIFAAMLAMYAVAVGDLECGGCGGTPAPQTGEKICSMKTDRYYGFAFCATCRQRYGREMELCEEAKARDWNIDTPLALPIMQRVVSGLEEEDANAGNVIPFGPSKGETVIGFTRTEGPPPLALVKANKP